MIQDSGENKHQKQDKLTPVEVYIGLTDIEGNKKLVKKLDSSNEKKNGGLNYWALGESCMMAYSEQMKTLALHISRTMTKGGDGLNHQGAIFMMYESDTLNWIKDEVFTQGYSSVQGQTCGHSFANTQLKITEDGKFTGMDLGDNYPRGINFWAFTRDTKVMNLIYQFKTLHGEEAQSPSGATYPKYDEISGGSQNFYKWSNDNQVYTELSAEGFQEVSDGYIAFFVGEFPALDNSKTGKEYNAPRNIAFTKISKDQKTKLSPGGKESGGFFTF